MKTSLSELPRLKFQVRTRARRGFSLIELLGVLAIMGVLAALTVPPVIRQIRQAQATGEDEKLRQVGKTIVASIQATGTIPNPNVAADNAAGWFTLARDYTALSQDALRNVFPDNPFTERRYYLDPAFDAYLNALVPPYQTPLNGFPETGFPAGALRILLVSSSRGILNPPGPNDPLLPGGVGVNLPAADQEALRNWNKIFSGGVASVPLLPVNPFGGLWAGLGEFLHVESFDLRSIFCRVTLIDFASPTTATATAPGGAVSNYTLPSVVGTQSGYSFNFTVTAGEIFVGDTGSLFSASRQMVARPGPPPPVNIPDTPVPNPIAQFQISMANPPWWGITPPGVGPGNQMPTTANTETFYVIKGTSLSLYPSGSVLTPPPILTVQINADSTFEYFNGSWTRVD